MTKKQKKMLKRIIVSAVLMIGIAFLPVEGIWRFLLYLIPYLIVGYDILKKAGKGILNRQVFDENFLMAIATVVSPLKGTRPVSISNKVIPNEYTSLFSSLYPPLACSGDV